MKWVRTYDISKGDAFIVLQGCVDHHTKVSVQLDTEPLFNGTNTDAYLVQSNNLELDPALWHELPEAPLRLPTGEGSALLSTFSFTAKYIALVIEAGNATTGLIELYHNYNANT